MMNILERLVAPTPRFFQQTRNWGIAITAVSTAIASIALPLPSGITELARYLAVAGAVLSGISQSAVKNE